MGLNSKSGSASTVNLDLVNNWITDPKNLIKSLNKNFTSTCAEMDKMTRTHVRDLLKMATVGQYPLSYELFALLDKEIKWNSPNINTYAETLAIFFRKSNTVINEADFAIHDFTGTTFIKTAVKIIKLKKWNLLAEFLLRIKGDAAWEKIYHPSVVLKITNDNSDPTNNPEIQRCIHILIEAYQKINLEKITYPMTQVTDEILKLSRNNASYYYSYIKSNPIVTLNTFNPINCSANNIHYQRANISTHQGNVNFKKYEIYDTISTSQSFYNLFQIMGRISAADLYIGANNRLKKEIAAALPIEGSPFSPTRSFFDKLFSDVFSYGTITDFSWLNTLDLTDELNKDPEPIIARINQIIEWEYFDAVVNLLAPLPPELAGKVIFNITPAAWETIKEMEAENMINKMTNIVLSLTENQLETLTSSTHFCILTAIYNSTSSEYDQTKKEMALSIYIKHHAFYNRHVNHAEIINNITAYTEGIVNQKINENYKTSIDQNLLIALQYKINDHINNPNTYIALLKTNFILAYRYFEAMTSDQKSSLISNAISLQEPLTETLISIYSCGAYGDKNRQRVYSIVEKNYHADSIDKKILRIGETHLPRSLANYYGSITFKALFKKVRAFDNIISEYTTERFNRVIQEINATFIMREMLSDMLGKILPPMGNAHIKLPENPSDLPCTIFELIQDKNADLILRILGVMPPQIISSAMQEFFTKDVFDIAFDRFKEWFVQNINIILQMTETADHASYHIDQNMINREHLNDFAVMLLKHDKEYAGRFIKWLVNNPSASYLIGMMSTELLDLLKSKEYELYAAALVKHFPEAWAHHHGFYLEVSAKMKANPLLVLDALSSESTISTLPPTAPVSDEASSAGQGPAPGYVPPPAYVPNPAYVPAPAGNIEAPEPDDVQQLTRMENTLMRIEAAMNKSSASSSSNAERQRIHKIIPELCKLAVDKTREIADLKIEMKALKSLNQEPLKHVLKFHSHARQNDDKTTPSRQRSNSF